MLRLFGEPEVTGLIAPLFDDYCTIRRLLVDGAMRVRMGRAARGLLIAFMVASASALLHSLSQGATEASRFAAIHLVVYWVAAIFWLVVAPAWLLAKSTVRTPLIMTLTGWVVLVPAWLAIVALQDEPARLLSIVGVVWMADTAAYLYGRRFGRHRLAPRISPGKTWEGFGGAIALSTLASVVCRLLPRCCPANRCFSVTVRRPV